MVEIKTKFLDDNIREYLHGLGPNKDFLNRTHDSNKPRKENMTYFIKVLSLSYVKVNVFKVY